LGGGGNDVVKITNTNEIQILSAGYQKPAKTGKIQAQATLASGIGSFESIPRLHNMKKEDDFFGSKRLYSSLNY